ncbi:MAG TPA: LysR family transcriptional regulator [Conexibacter sp.]|jgi:DNA-binding transcriptional LysR family regulator|nr:LysR family transcriptional regulator [Conexibacter sp.]
MSVELRHLRYFVAVAEELSFTRAAARLHMAQPPLSTQIRDLERALGVQLLDRSRRAVRLTPAGEALLAEARRLLVQTEQTLQAVRRAGQGEVGQLTIGFVPSAANSVLPGHLRTFRQRHPDVELYLREMPPDDLVRALHDGGVDLCFLHLPLLDERVETLVVSEQPLRAALPIDHPLSGRKRIAVAALAEEPFVMPAQYRVPGLHAQVTEACRRAGFTPKAVQKDVWQIQTIVGLVAAGIGVALVPASAETMRRTGVAYVPLRGDVPSVRLGAAWRRDAQAPVAERFRELLAEAPALD